MMNDPYILLSIINTKLRDEDISLEDLCEKMNYELEKITQVLSSINYYYDKDQNQFKLK